MLVIIRAFASFFPLVTEKDVKALNKMISTSDWHVKHLFTGQNTQRQTLPKVFLLI